MNHPEDLLLGDHLDAAERDIEAPEADAVEQARPVREEDGPEAGFFSPSPEVDVADAVEQAHPVHQPDDDYR